MLARVLYALIPVIVNERAFGHIKSDVGAGATAWTMNRHFDGEPSKPSSRACDRAVERAAEHNGKPLVVSKVEAWMESHH